MLKLQVLSWYISSTFHDCGYLNRSQRYQDSANILNRRMTRQKSSLAGNKALKNEGLILIKCRCYYN